MADIKLSDDGRLAVPKLAQQASVGESYFCSSAMVRVARVTVLATKLFFSAIFRAAVHR
jgi:hypothetical protein